MQHLCPCSPLHPSPKTVVPRTPLVHSKYSPSSSKVITLLSTILIIHSECFLVYMAVRAGNFTGERKYVGPILLSSGRGKTSTCLIEFTVMNVLKSKLISCIGRFWSFCFTCHQHVFIIFNKILVNIVSTGSGQIESKLLTMLFWFLYDSY